MKVGIYPMFAEKQRMKMGGYPCHFGSKRILIEINGLYFVEEEGFFWRVRSIV